MDKTKALGKCMDLCSRKEYCISEIKQKLFKWELSGSEIEEVISNLLKEKFIDESRFVKAFVKDKFRFNKWGRNKIKYHLSQKQVSSELVYEGLNQINEDEYMEVLESVLKEKLRKVKAKSDFERNGKVANFMASRGFEANLVFRYLNSDFDE